jgi:hypothetical protein
MHGDVSTLKSALHPLKSKKTENIINKLCYDMRRYKLINITHKPNRTTEINVLIHSDVELNETE